MIRGVYRKYGSDIGRFREGLTVYSRELIDILSASTSKIVRQAEVLLRDNRGKKVLVFSYSKSIALTLKRLAKSLEDNLQVVVCKSGCLEEG
jgi:translation initiation factor 2B subunit (eIF-2B alpha/beta/delta family)